MALGYKGIAYDIEPIHLVQNGGEQFSERYSKLNPLQQVPSLLLDNGMILTQSIAIIEYLEELYPNPSLRPSDVFLRAKMREYTEIINAGIQPLQNLSLLLHLESLKEGAKLSWGRSVISKGLQALEEKSQQTVGQFLIGDSFTMADCALLPQLYNARRFGCDLSTVPQLLRIEANCQAFDFVAEASPEHQVDAQ